jgi:hypothetical protein
MNQKSLAIVIVAVLIVAVVGVAAYWALSSGGETNDGETNDGETNNGETNDGETNDGETNDGETNDGETNVGNASSLQFSVSIVREGESYETMYSAKNIGTSDLMIRIDLSTTEGDIVYIVNGAQQKAWEYVGDEWNDLSDAFSAQWDMWNPTLQGYTDNLSSWTGAEEWTYTDTDGSPVTIYDITVNQSLADSLFEP